MGAKGFLKRFFSLLLKSVFTLPGMLLYFMQPIIFNESLFYEMFEGKNKR